ncbi:MAG: sugar transferase [Chlorobi bacterium]|nr:sugar transferase [Chlorobiota bacterium]
MYGMNGIEYAGILRGNKRLLKTPIILLAFEKDDDLLKKSFAAKGIIDDLYFYPVKPIDIYNRIRSLQQYYSEILDQKVKKKKKYEYKIPLMKRGFDILVSASVLLMISPILLIVSLAIRLESKGPIVYKSKRVGTGYKIFDFLKFRSMYTGADAKLAELKHLNQYSDGKNGGKEKKAEKDYELDFNCPECAKLPEGEHCSPILYIKGHKICENWYIKQKKELTDSTFIKISNDPRITKVGNFIRNTSIDELPQLFNVLKGDMSIVGNRPLPLYEAELLTSDDWSLRFMGPAGITGLWQVELRGKKGVMSEEERKMLDNQYANNYSFWGDIKLILRTIPALLQKDNV